MTIILGRMSGKMVEISVALFYSLRYAVGVRFVIFLNDLVK